MFFEWLETKEPGYASLSQREREAITDFPLMWSLFEFRILNSNASANAIHTIVSKWQEAGTLQPDMYSEALEYFRKRYFVDGAPTNHFRNLNLRGNDRPGMVRHVLLGSNYDPVDCVAACFIVIYRFRNNMFHGGKFGYQFQGQFENFDMANTVLAMALERHGDFSGGVSR